MLRASNFENSDSHRSLRNFDGKEALIERADELEDGKRSFLCHQTRDTVKLFRLWRDKTGESWEAMSYDQVSDEICWPEVVSYENYVDYSGIRLQVIWLGDEERIVVDQSLGVRYIDARGAASELLPVESEPAVEDTTTRQLGWYGLQQAS